jgi:hypothetical protein
MCERGKRTWPTKGLLRLARLELAWVAAENLPFKETSLVPELVEAIGKLKNRMKECLEKAGFLQRMLDSMKTLSLLLKTKEKTLQLLSEPGTSSIHQGWVEIQQYEIGKPLAENSLAKQIMIEHQVNTLQAEAAAAAATIERLERQMEEERPDAAEQNLIGSVPRHQGAETALLHDPVETTELIFLATIETPVLNAAGEKHLQRSQKQDTIVHSSSKGFFEPPGSDLCFNATGEKSRIDSGQQRQYYGRICYHGTTSTANTPRRRHLQRKVSHPLFRQLQDVDKSHFSKLQVRNTERIRDIGVQGDDGFTIRI